MAFLEEEIPLLESKIQDIDAQMMGEAASDYMKLEELVLQKEELENTLIALYEEWEAGQT